MAGGILGYTAIDLCGRCGRFVPIGGRKRVVLVGLAKLDGDEVRVTCGACLGERECSGSCGHCSSALRADPSVCVLAASRARQEDRDGGDAQGG